MHVLVGTSLMYSIVHPLCNAQILHVNLHLFTSGPYANHFHSVYLIPFIPKEIRIYPLAILANQC